MSVNQPGDHAVKIEDALAGVTLLFLDSAAVIYFVENHPTYAPIAQRIFQRLDDGTLKAVTSPITLAECLVVPRRCHDDATIARFNDLIVNGAGVQFAHIDEVIANKASVLRAEYTMRLPDALQLATATVARCEAFVTNDARPKQVRDIRVIVIGELVV
jgi:predicted nucleic acid-binding protein